MIPDQCPPDTASPAEAKTMLALEKAVRLAGDGARTLLLCFNRALADDLAARARERDAGVRVFSFHRLCQTPSPKQPNAIRFTTISSFKGLESDCVILCGVREGDDKAGPRYPYVGCSRAKHVLDVVRRSDG
jgi:superfamily I DNA/RNA helicase